MYTPQELTESAQKHFGINAFRPGQEEIIVNVMQGRDAFGRMPTGHGKSLCFQLPAVLSPNSTVVISPLIALMRDQIRALEDKGITTASIHSQQTTGETAQSIQVIRTGTAKLIYAAPEQLGDALFLNLLERVDIDRLVIDEAHCVSTWGHDFRPAFRRIPRFAEQRGIKQRTAFTATASTKVVDDIKTSLKMVDPFIYIGDLHRPNLTYTVEHSKNAHAKATSLLRIVTEHKKKGESVLVYCATRKEVIELKDFLTRKRIRCAFYHGHMQQEERHQAEIDFLNGTIPVMIATNAFGMGIDKADIRAIVHFSIPGTPENYIQETGRAGRDGLPSSCVLLYCPKDEKIQRSFRLSNNPDITTIQYVFNCLRTQQRQTPALANGSFILDWKALNFAVSKRLRDIQQVAPAIATLEKFGLVILSGETALIPNLWEEKKQDIEAYIEAKKTYAGSRFERMRKYATAPEPNQTLLLSLL